MNLIDHRIGDGQTERVTVNMRYYAPELFNDKSLGRNKKEHVLAISEIDQFPLSLFGADIGIDVRAAVDPILVQDPYLILHQGLDGIHNDA
jgi:hypothetical protein